MRHWGIECFAKAAQQPGTKPAGEAPEFWGLDTPWEFSQLPNYEQGELSKSLFKIRHWADDGREQVLHTLTV